MLFRSIARGRSLNPAYVQTIATGATWLAADAMAAGLVDQIVGFDQAVVGLQNEILRRQAAQAVAAQSKQETSAMRVETTAAPVDEKVDETKPADQQDQQEENKAEPVAEPAAKKIESENAADFISAFGDVGARWFLEGKSFSQCQALKIADLEKTIAALTDDNKKLDAVVETLRGTSAARFSHEQIGRAHV